MTTFFCGEEISSKKWSVFESWGKNDSSKKKATTLETFWVWKKLKRRQQKRRKQKSKRRQRYDSPPNNIYYEENSQRRSIHRSLKESIMWEVENKEATFVPKSFHSTSVGRRSPVQWLLCFIAMFWLFEFAKISIQNVRKAMANFASIRRSSKQNKMFVLYKHFTALSRPNRRPRIFNQMYRATFSFLKLYRSLRPQWIFRRWEFPS